MVPLIGVIAGTGAIGPEIDDGSVVYLLAKPVRRSTIIFTKLFVAIGVTVVFSAVPTLLAGFILNGNSQQLAVAYAVRRPSPRSPTARSSCCLGTVTRHAVVVGLVYALVWESLVGTLVPGAQRSASSSGRWRSARRRPRRARSPPMSNCRWPSACWWPSRLLPPGMPPAV